LNRPEVQEARLKGLGSSVRYSRTLQEDMLYVAIPMMTDNQITGYVRLARPLKEVRDSIDNVYRYIYMTLFIIALPSLLLAFLFSRNITSPIRRMTEFTQKMRNGESPGALIMDSQDEIGQLAHDMNSIFNDQQEKVRLAMEETSKLQAAFASMVEGILILDGENRIQACNRSLRLMTAMDYADMEGKTPLEAFRNASLQDALNRFQKSGQAVLEEIVFREENPIIAVVTIADIHGLPGDEKKTIMVFHDITRLKKLERMRSDFIVNVTHELRTPLTAIIGYSETLQDSAVDEASRQKYLKIIHDHACRLGRLIDDLLTLSNLEQGETEMHMESISLREIVNNLLPIVKSKADEKNLPIILEIPEDLPPIHGDRDKIVQIILNILDNAIKFTASGKITLGAYRAEEVGFVALFITDTGPGIPKSEIPRLGERFYRVDRTRSRELGGTGLGLSIVKHLMKAHHGWIKIESASGRGTTVSLIFPTFTTDGTLDG
ncbi:MAG: ATP-binding protein, partial [Syntrophales bacterium]|nr:ATP-binding protein [Syntrophales bacterium]